MQRLQGYDWPGNVRELQHILERALITSTTIRLQIELPSTAAQTIDKIAEEPSTVRTDAEMRRLEADNIRPR